MFGGSHSIDGTTYTYDTSTDDGTYQTDTYLDGNGNAVTMRGRIGASVAVAEVSGAYEGVFDGSGIHPLSVVTSPISAINFTSPNGRHYTEQFDRTVWTVDLDSDTVIMSERTVYAGNAGEFFVPAGGADGDVGGSESGCVVAGQLLLNESGGNSWQPGTGPSISLFGTTYHKVSMTYSTSYDAGGASSSSSQTTYLSGDGSGSFSQNLWSDFWNGDGGSMSGNDPYVGNWSATNIDLLNPNFEVLQAPKFAPQVIMVNGSLVNWSESILTSRAGAIIDSFYGEGIALTISGNARAFALEDAAATVTVTIGSQSHTGTISNNGEVSGFNSAVCHVQAADLSRSTPLFSVGTLYVDDIPYVFAGGYEDSTGHRVDQYDHDGVLLRLVGITSLPASASVRYSTMEGTYASGFFTMPGCVIRDTLVDVPAAFWVDGVLYNKAAGTTYTSAASPPQSFILSGEQMYDLSLSGTLSGSTLAGTYNAEQGGVFNVTLDGVSRLACPANVSGATKQGPSLEGIVNGDHPEFDGLPAAVRIPISGGPQPHAVLDFLGLATDDDTAGDLVACYGHAKVPESDPTSYWKQNLHLLKIRPATGTSKAVTLRDYRAAKATDGFYDTSSRLFQAELKVSTASIKALPMPVMSLEPANNYAFWFIDGPAGGLPRSFIIRGQPWWYAGEVGGKPTYRGFYNVQQMSLGAADTSGQRLVNLTDYQRNNDGSLKVGTTQDTQGTLSSARGSVRLRDGTLALSGTDTGTQETITIADDYSLHTIRSDVDIIGNNLSFGVLDDDASRAGASWGFRDGGTKASLHSIMSRSIADWYWWKQDGTSTDAFRAVMVLDQYQRLQIYPPAPQPNTYPGIVLDPSGGVSMFKGPVRVMPGGDISMGAYTEGPPP